MKTIFTRSLALLLTLVMLLTMLPVSALGEEMTENDVEDVTETVLEMTDDEMAEAIENEEAPFTEEVAPPIEETTDSDNEANLLTEEEEAPELPSDDPDSKGSMQEDEPNETEISSIEDSEDESFPDEPDEETVSPTDAPDESEEEPATESSEEPAYSSLEEEVNALYDGSFIKYAIYNFGHVYITTKSSETKVYEASALENSEVICTIAEKGSILLGFEYAERWDNRSVLAWFLNDAYEAFSGYVAESDLEKYTMEDADAAAWMNVLPSAYLSTTDGQFPVFAVPFLVPASEEEVPETEPAAQEETEEPVVEQEVLEEPVEDDPVTSDTQDEEPEEVDPYESEVTIGTFLSVTTDTRVFSDMDETVSEDNNGDHYMGVFVKDAIVQVASIRGDHSDRQWYEVAYLYGDDFADGTMKWVEIGTAYVLPEETTLTEADDFTVTDIALPYTPKSSGKRMMLKAAGASAMNGFTLKSINGAIPPLYAGQTGVYGSSGRDSDYRQIASVSGHGVVYATPHYLDGYTVYCLEHNLPGPGEGSGSSQQPKGPYVIVDIDTYMNTPGNSKVIYSTQTMHAIAWVLRHTYPFMVLDRSDSDNETWSRVAGQFAIRQVIRELEGAQYVRDYWNMDNFYVASGQAPAVYLEYARWLASNGIARGRITGYISMANKSISKVGSNYVGTVTLYTDTDLIRIAKSTGSVTGNTGGSDYNYYYLNSGDTITVTSSTNGFSLVAESVNSDAEEASFLVGVPSAAIQKVLIPQYGAPYAMQSLSMWFEQEIQYGSLTVTKLRSGTQQKLAGAKLQLYDSSKKAYGDPVTTDANGQVKWTNLPYGTYYVGEVGAPAGYQVNVNQVQVTINGNNTASFEDSPIIGSVSFVKKQQGTEIPLIGAQYELVTKSGSTYKRAASAADGSELPVLTTDKNGKATWNNVVEYGSYYVHEVKAPEGFLLDNTYHAVSVTEHNKIVSADVQDPIITAKIKIAKTDGLTKEPLAGVEFTITRLSGPAALNGAGVGEVAAVIVTDKNGYAETDWLTWGRFKVEETKVPAGYTDSRYSTEIEAYEDGKTYTISVENIPAAGYIRLTKTDADSKKPLKGVQFDIYQGDELISTMTTDASGVALSGALVKGTYTVKEHNNPEGYIGELTTLTAEVISEKTTDLTADNTPIRGKIKILKRDALTKEALAGVVFTITRMTASPASDDADVGKSFTLTTDKNGMAESGWLDYGKFKIEETSVPEHYVNSHFSTEVEINENEKTYAVEVENEPTQGKIQITKTDKLDGKPISGVVFDIYNGDTKVGSMTTNEKGIAVSGSLPKGNYTVKEKDNPEGYIADLVSLDCEVFSDETTKLTADNMPIQFRVKIQKTDGLTKKPLAGAVFTITRISGLPSHNGAGNGKVVATLTTDAKGVAVSDLLTWGQYEVTETTVPEHYVDNGFTTTVTGAENNKTYTITCENEPTKGWIRLAKTDSLDKHPISGVQFDILQDGKIISTMTTDANGVAVSEPLHKGLYTVREHENPTGYTAELVSLDCEVFSDQTTELTASNTPIQFRVKIVKTDQLTKEPLAGAEFTITRKTGLPSHDGEEDGKVVAVLVTDEKGEATSELLTWGKYEVTETKVPVHFVDNHFTTTATGSEDQKTYTISCENEPTKGYIKIVKTDKLDRTPIEGVQFDIYENDEYGSGLAATMTTDKNGVAVSPALRKGKYILKEHANPTGYTTDLAEIDCVVKSDETTNLSCTNTPIQGKIRIIKTDELTKEALAGAEFTITRVSGLPSHKGSNDGEVVAVIVTDANGIAVTPLLTWGVYHVEETGVPVHYVDNHFSADVTIETEDLLTYDVPCENEPTKGWIRLKKTDRINGNPISGVQFDIFYNDQYGEGLAATMITDENGIAMSEPIRKGQYIVKEHGETAGYVFEEVTLNCTVKSDEITDLSATNQPVQVRLKLYKRDADEYAGDPAAIPAVRGDGVLTGAVFQVLAGADILDRQGNVIYHKGDLVIESIKTSGEDASVTTDELWPGVYEIVELTPPVGYQPTDKHTIVDASSAAQQSKEKVITYESVVCNEILYGCYAFVKFTGDNEIHDEAGLIETPEPGAVFKVYLKKAGSFDAARVFEKDTITTDEYGKAATKLLPYGIYTVQQTRAKEGYAIKAPFDIFIRGTESPDNPPSMILNNEAIRYRLKFIKVDAETGKTITLANTAFKLKDANGEYVKQTVHYPRTQEIDTFKTDADGTVTLPETVRYGLYFIEEFTAPEGYLIQTNEVAVFVGDENMNQPGEAYLLEFEIEDAPVMGQIRLEKTGLQLIGFKEKEDRYGNTVMQPIYEEKRLAGATFEVHASEDIVGKEGTIWYHADELVDTITTTKEGPDLSKTLPLGRYYLVEVSAPEGFTFDDRHYEANLIYSDDHTPLVETVVTAGNTFIPSEISLKKEKEVLQLVRDGELIKQTITEAPGEGFVFGLYNDTDIRYEGGTLMADTLVGVGTTDKDGSLTFAGYYPHGRYYIKELSAPVGWKINTDKFMVVLDPHTADEDHVIRATLPETVHDELIWYPVTLTKLDITGEKTLPGALIEVTNDKGEVIYRAYTDQNGQIPNIPVTPGSYHFREVIAPSGYALNEAVMSFTVDEQGGITGETSIRDDYTRILLMKKDENGLPLAGVEFSLVKSNGAVLMRKSSDADGKIVFEEIPFGEYTITESKALAGYQKHEISIKLSIDGTYVNKEEPLETIINYPIIVKLKKVDQDNKPLPGAEYALINEFGEQTMTAVSDADGMLTFYKVPYGKYTLKELFAPEGYLLSKETPEIIIDDAWQNSDLPALTLTNHLKRLRYIKVDTSGKYLPGVEFSLINASNGEVDEVVKSNERGEFIFTKFDYGFWLIRETKTPDGYCQMKDITFSVDASWTEPAPLTCINIPNYYEFVKTDNEGHPMAGVSFTLEDCDGHILRDLVSGDDGIVHVYDLVPGTYIIREIETWEGYTVSGEVIELVIDEHYIIPDEMYVMVNYPDIQTGVDQEITPMMYAGGAVLLAGLILLIFILLKKLRGR